MELKIEDKNGKPLGMLVLQDEVNRILKYASVNLVIEYDVHTDKATGYLSAEGVKLAADEEESSEPYEETTKQNQS